ncbi:MAG: diguanylate cyclase, partial [Proteobacteria bacterium]|nr:diguanylate cyclase [Pseudomonadota bacterium]
MESSFDVGMDVVIDFIDVNVRSRVFFVMDLREIPRNAVSREHRHLRKRCLCLTVKKVYSEFTLDHQNPGPDMCPQNARILLVDDETTLLELLGDFLREQGHEVILADSGIKALDLYNSELPDLVLLDLKLPDLSGLDVLKHISSRDDETGLIVISGVGSTDDAIEALRRGAWDFLVKPFLNLEFVLHAVNKSLEKVHLKRENRLYREHLEEEVQRRTTELRQEIIARKRIEEDLRRSEMRYKELSLTDELTGLYNARHFFRQVQAEVERAMRYNSPLSLCVLDIDNFKQYNDTYGHLNGDAVLSELGRIIQKLIRDADSAYRYGGEEFIIVLPET